MFSRKNNESRNKAFPDTLILVFIVLRYLNHILEYCWVIEKLPAYRVSREYSALRHTFVGAVSLGFVWLHKVWHFTNVTLCIWNYDVFCEHLKIQPSHQNWQPLLGSSHKPKSHFFPCWFNLNLIFCRRGALLEGRSLLWGFGDSPK